MNGAFCRELWKTAGNRRVFASLPAVAVKERNHPLAGARVSLRLSGKIDQLRKNFHG
jgi:hypothetical protein